MRAMLSLPVLLTALEDIFVDDSNTLSIIVPILWCVTAKVAH